MAQWGRRRSKKGQRNMKSGQTELRGYYVNEGHIILEGTSSQMLIKLCVQPWTGLTFKTFEVLLPLKLEQGLGGPLHRPEICPSTAALCRILERSLGAEGHAEWEGAYWQKVLSIQYTFFTVLIAGVS